MISTMMDHTHWVPPSRVLASARDSTAEKGKRMTDDLCLRVAAALLKEFRHGD